MRKGTMTGSRLNKEAIYSRLKLGWRSKWGHASLLTLSRKTDEDICNGSRNGKSVGYRFSLQTSSQLERFVQHNEGLSNDLSLKPDLGPTLFKFCLSFCRLRSLFWNWQVSPRNICQQLRISAYNFKASSLNCLKSRSAKAPNDSPVAGGAWQQKVWKKTHVCR